MMEMTTTTACKGFKTLVAEVEEQNDEFLCLIFNWKRLSRPKSHNFALSEKSESSEFGFNGFPTAESF